MEFEFIEHNTCSESLLVEICMLKQQFWNYSIEEQLLWIKNNIKKTDIHLVLKNNNRLIGYLTLTDEQILYNGKEEVKRFLGVGSVCVCEKHRGKKLGILLIKLVNYFLLLKKIPGILLCKKELLEFYKKCGWSVYKGEVYHKEEKFNDLLFFSNNEQNKLKSITLCKLF